MKNIDFKFMLQLVLWREAEKFLSDVVPLESNGPIGEFFDTIDIHPEHSNSRYFASSHSTMGFSIYTTVLRNGKPYNSYYINGVVATGEIKFNDITTDVRTEPGGYAGEVIYDKEKHDAELYSDRLRYDS